jgi:hypothetical protein
MSLCLEAKQRYREKHKTNCIITAKRNNNKEEKKDTNELKAECPVSRSIINKYQVKRQDENLKHRI